MFQNHVEHDELHIICSILIFICRSTIFVSFFKFFARYLNTNILLENMKCKLKYKYNVFLLHENNVSVLAKGSQNHLIFFRNQF